MAKKKVLNMNAYQHPATGKLAEPNHFHLRGTPIDLWGSSYDFFYYPCSGEFFVLNEAADAEALRFMKGHQYPLDTFQQDDKICAALYDEFVAMSQRTINAAASLAGKTSATIRLTTGDAFKLVQTFGFITTTAPWTTWIPTRRAGRRAGAPAKGSPAALRGKRTK